MKTLKDFIAEDHKPITKDAENLKKLLKRTSKSLGNHAGRGNGPHTQRGYELRDRYDGAKDKLKKMSYQAWLEYCKEMDYDPAHDGLDHYA